MTKDKDLAMYVAVYSNADDAKADLDAIEQLRKEDLIGTFDAAVVEKKNGNAHIVKRMDRPMVRILPEEFGFGPLSRRELKEAASELEANEASLIMVGEPTIEKAFDIAVTHAEKSLKKILNATADELAKELKEAVGS